MEIPGDGGSTVKPSLKWKILGVGVKLEKKNLHGGYGYFLEPHIECSKCFIV